MVENMSSEFKKFCLENRIRVIKTVLRTLEQNNVVEE